MGKTNGKEEEEEATFTSWQLAKQQQQHTWVLRSIV